MVALITQVAGLAAVAVGCFLIAPSVGFIAVGLSILALGVAIERAGGE